MATIAQIVRQGKGKAGSNNSWEVIYMGESETYLLWHYQTLMMEWDKSGPLYMCTGHGSVSDQGGMNTAFKVLGFPYRYDRQGGANIREIFKECS